MTDSWKSEGGQRKNRLVDAAHDITNQIISTDPYLNVDDKEGIYFNKEGAPSILGVGTKTPFSRLSFGDYDVNNIENSIEKADSLVNNPSIAFTETSNGTNSTGISFYRESSTGTEAEIRGLRFVVNNDENGTLKDTGLVPGVGSINVKNDNTSMLITNDGQNKKVFINSKESQFANTTSGLEINGDCRVTQGIILKGQQTQLVRSETGLIFYDENEKTLKYSTGTTGDDIYNLMAQNSSGHILGVSGEYAINFQDYSANVGLVQDISSGGILFAFKDVGFIIGNGDMFKTYSDGTHINESLSGITFGTGTGGSGVGKQNIPALAVIGHNQPDGASANGNVIVSHISDVEPIPIISRTETDMSANGVIYLQNNVTIGVKQPMAVIDVSKIDVPLLRMGSNVHAYYNSVIIGKDISGSSNSFYFGNNIENKANFDSSFNLVFGDDITIENSSSDFEQNLIFGSGITVSKNNNFVFGRDLELPETKDLSFCVLLGKNGQAERGDLIRYFEDGTSVFKLTHGGNMDMLGNMIIRKDISANDASFNNLDVKNINNVDTIGIIDISSVNVTIENKLSVGYLDLSGNSETNPNFGNSKTHPNFALDVSGGLNLTGYADMDDYILKINKTNSVESGKILAGKLDLSHNNLIRASLDASGSILILNNEGEEGLTNLYGRTILQNDISGNTILTADGNGVTNATKIHMTTFQDNNTQNHFVFDGSGNFGLGIDHPQAKFHLFDGVGYEPNQYVEGIQMGKHNGTGDYNLIINTDEEKKAIIGFSDISNNSNKAHIQYDNSTNIMNINSSDSVQINRNNVLMVEINDIGLKIPSGTLDAKFLKIDGTIFDTEASSAWTSTNVTDLSGNKQSLFVPFDIGINQKTVTGINNYQVKFNLDISGNVRTNDLFFGKIYLNMIPKIITSSSTIIQNNLYGSGSYEIIEANTGNSYSAWKMFDNDDNSYWSILSDAAVDAGVYYTTSNDIDTEFPFVGRYFEITLPHRWCLKKYSFKSTLNNTKMPEQWKVVAKIGEDTGNVEDISNNLWRLVDEKDISDNCWVDQSMNYFPVETSKYSNNSYRIFRFYLIKTFDGDISQNDIEICGMEMYGETNKITDISSNLIQTEIQDVSGEKHLSLQPLGGRVGIGTTRPAEHVILDISSTGAIRLPIGDTSERPGVDASGCLRYNDEKKQFEGYGENGWAGLGGVISNNQLITVKADDTNGLTFLTNDGGVSTEKMRMVNNGNVGLGTDTPKDRVILDISASGAIRLPMGTDLERPATVDASGCLRYNTETKQFEGYGDGGWAGLGGVVDKDLDTRIAAEENDDEDKLRFFTGGTEQLVIDVSGNLDVKGVLKVKGFISENKDVIEKTIYGGETGTELCASAKYGYFDIDYEGGVYDANGYTLPIKAYPGAVLQFNLLGITAATKLVTNAGLDPSGLVHVDNDNNITRGNGSGHTKGTFIWHVPFDAIGNYKLQNAGNTSETHPIIITPLNSDLSSNNIVVNHLHGREIKSSQIIMGKDNASNKVILDISANGAIRLPMGTDAERPSTVDASGCLRYNTETKQFEGYGDGGWAGLGGVVDKDLDTRIAAEENDDEDKLRFFTGGTEQLVIDVSGNLDVKGVLKVKGFISEHKDIIEKTIYGGETGTELCASAKYGYFDIDYDGGVYDANGYTLPIKAYPGAVLQFNLLGITAVTKLVTNAGLDPSGLVFVDNDNNITSGNGSGHTKGTFIWYVPFDAVGNFKLQNAGNTSEILAIMIAPLNSDLSSNNVVSNNITAVNLNSDSGTITTLGSTNINTTNVTATGDIIIGATNVLSKLNTNANSVSILEPNCLNKIEKKLIYVYVRTKNGTNPYNGQGSGSCYYFKTDGIEFESPILQLTVGVTYRFNQEDGTNTGHPIKFYETIDKQNEISSINIPQLNEGLTEITITHSTKQVLYYQCGNHEYMGNIAYVTGSLNLTDISVNEISGNTIKTNYLESKTGSLILVDISVNEISGSNITANYVETIDLSANDISGVNVYAKKITLTGDLSGNNARLHDVSVNRLWIGDIEMIGHVTGNISNPTSVGTLAGNFVVAGDMSGNDASFNVVDTSQLSISNSSLKLGGGAVPGNIKYESGKFYGYNESKWAGLGGVVSDSERVYVDASDNSGLTFFTSDGVNSVESMHILNNGQVNIGSITNVVSVINSKAATTYVDSKILTEITNLIGGAPGALDTLNELAAALGDDASYATTVTNNLALKAPLASPTFTGNVSGISKTMVGLGNVTNESKATMFSSPSFTGTFRAGNSNTASGTNAVAMGSSNTASGINAVALGNNNTASAAYSVAMGSSNSATGTRSAVFGESNITSGSYSFAMGWSNTPQGSMSGCMGRKNTIVAGYAFAAGVCNQITGNSGGYGCVALGNKAYVDGDIRFAIGISDTNPSDTHATSASNNNKFVIDKDGNVGIGTSSPYGVLEVKNNVREANFGDSTWNPTLIVNGGNTSAQTNSSSIFLNTISGNMSFGWNIQANGEAGNLNNFSIRQKAGGSVVDETRFHIDNQGRVGIGETSPGYKLHIKNETLDNSIQDLLCLETHCNSQTEPRPGPAILFRERWNNSATDYWNLARIQGMEEGGFGGQLAFFTNNGAGSPDDTLLERMRIDEDGNVGIGTSSPGEKLEVNGNLRVAAGSKFITGNTQVEGWGHIGRTDGDLYLQWAGAGKNLLVCGDGGKVIIGSGSSSDEILPLHINGGGGDNGQVLKVSCTRACWFELEADSDSSNPEQWGICSADDGPLHFYKRAGTDAGHFRMTLTGDGKLGIGTQSPSCPLDIEISTSVNTGQRDYWYGTAYTGGYYVARIANASTFGLCIDAREGFVLAKVANPSDQRIKKNIVEIDDGASLKKVRDISCVWYNYIDQNRNTNVRVAGFIAQQVKEHLPEAVALESGFIPNEMRILNVNWSETIMKTNDLQDVSGVKYRFYVSDLSGNEERKIELVGTPDNSFTFEKKWDIVFCYGKEVDDFHIIDKQKIFAVAFSATQEIDKIQQAEKTKLAEQTTKLAEQTTKLAEQTTKLAAAETEITTLKTQLAAVLARLDALESA